MSNCYILYGIECNDLYLSVTAAANSGSLVKTGYTFAGWNTLANGSGTDYVAGSGTFSIAADTTLYAKWTPIPTTYTVTYDGNGNTGGNVPTDSTSYTNGQTVNVLGNTGSLVKSKKSALAQYRT